MKIKIKKLHPDAIIKEYKTDGAAGFDLCSICEDFYISAGGASSVHTGLSFQIPEGYVMLIFPRSGLAWNNQINLLNCVGVIDSDYRGEVKVLLHNHNNRKNHSFKKGDRIAQGVIVPIIKADFVEVDELNETARGSGGFGSTGV